MPKQPNLPMIQIVTIGIYLLFQMTHASAYSTCSNASCAGRCGRFDPSPDGECYCEVGCLEYGDCCLDYLQACPDNNSAKSDLDLHIKEFPNNITFTNSTVDLSRTLLLNQGDRGFDGNADDQSDFIFVQYRSHSKQHYMECVDIMDYQEQTSRLVSMVASCPESQDLSSQALCQDPTTEDITRTLVDLERMVPVFDSRSNVLYRNRHCADCHGVHDTQAIPPEFICINNTEALVVKHQYGFKAFLLHLTSQCELMFKLSLIPSRYRSCDNEVIETCSDDESTHQNSNLVKQCPSYTAKVECQDDQGDNIIILKNQYCSDCNKFNTSQCRCMQTPAQDTGQFVTRLPPSFSVLIDFTSGGGVGVGDSIKFGDHTVCKETEYLDIVQDKCMERQCGDSEIVIDDDCVPMDLVKHSFIKPTENRNENLIYALLDSTMNESMTENLIEAVNMCKSYVESALHVAILNTTIATCQTLKFEYADVVNNERNYSQNYICVYLILKPIGNGTILNHFDGWIKVVDFLSSFTGQFVSLTVNSFDHKFFPTCGGVGHLQWYTNFSLLSYDPVALASDDFSFQVRIPALQQNFPDDSVLFQLTLEWSSNSLTHTTSKVGVCNLELYSCDKVTVDKDRYNVTGVNDTHSRLMLLSWEGDELVFDVANGEFGVTKNDEMLAVCADAVSGSIGSSDGLTEQSVHETIQSYMTVLGLALSIVCLVVTFIVHCVFPSLRTTAGKMLMNMSVSLMLAQLLFLTSGLGVGNYIACKAMAMCQHYSWLVSFCWMNVFAIDVSLTFVRMKQGVVGVVAGKRLLAYGFYAWGVPAWLCVTALFIDLTTDLSFTYGSSTVCWISPARAVLYSFALPIGLILLINAVCFLITLIVFVQTRKQASKASASSPNAEAVIICVKLSTVMGFTWLFGFMANIHSLWFLSYVFIFFNTLQGVFLCVSFVCTQRVYRLMKHFVQTGERVISSNPMSSSAPKKMASPRGSNLKSQSFNIM